MWLMFKEEGEISWLHKCDNLAGISLAFLAFSLEAKPEGERFCSKVNEIVVLGPLSEAGGNGKASLY